MSPDPGPGHEAENVPGTSYPGSARQVFSPSSLQKEKSRSGRTTGATRVHMYKEKHIQAEMIFTHTADMFAEIVSGNVVLLRA